MVIANVRIKPPYHQDTDFTGDNPEVVERIKKIARQKWQSMQSIT